MFFKPISKDILLKMMKFVRKKTVFKLFRKKQRPIVVNTNRCLWLFLNDFVKKKNDEHFPHKLNSIENLQSFSQWYQHLIHLNSTNIVCSFLVHWVSDFTQTDAIMSFTLAKLVKRFVSYRKTSSFFFDSVIILYLIPMRPYNKINIEPERRIRTLRIKI